MADLYMIETHRRTDSFTTLWQSATFARVAFNLSVRDLDRYGKTGDSVRLWYCADSTDETEPMRQITLDYHAIEA